jgi:hypothetical protein
MSLTAEQRDRIKACWSNIDASRFIELKERQQNVYINKLDEVVTSIVKESPDCFRGSVVQRIYLKGKYNGTV